MVERVTAKSNKRLKLSEINIQHPHTYDGSPFIYCWMIVCYVLRAITVNMAALS